ncbi:MAG: MFS transporter [Anaerolineales bacterium]|nr:MFS transporter [Anaerolineales bacterium]
MIWKRRLTGIITPGRVLFPLGLGTALSLMGDATLYTVLPTHAAETGIALIQVGIILSANRIVRLFLNGPMGLAYDRSRRRRLFISALFVGALSTVLYAATYDFWPLLVGRLLWGLAWSGIWVGGTTIILDVTTDDDRGRWTGLYQTWFFLGAAFGAFAGGLLTDQLGYHAAMWIGAAVTAFGGLIALLALPETRGVRPEISSSSAPNSSLDWYRNPGLWVVAVLQGINRFVFAGVLAATMALLVQDQMSNAELVIGVATLTGILMAGRTLLSMLSAPLSGTLSDRLGSRWGITAIGMVVGAVSMLLLSRSSPVSILLGVALGAVAGGGIQALVTAQTGDLVEQHQRGRAIGMLHTAGDLGSAAGPLVAYGLLVWIGFSGIFVLSAGLFAVGAILAWWYSRRIRSRSSGDISSRI